MAEAHSLRLDGYWVASTIGNHVVAGDEAVVSGGRDLGPSPFSLLLASLGH